MLSNFDTFTPMLLIPNNDVPNMYGGLGAWINEDGSTDVFGMSCQGASAVVGTGVGFCVGFRDG